VTDKSQRFVPNLAPGNFSIREDGVPQTVSVFAEERAPLDLAILIDTSASMTTLMGTAKHAASGLVRAEHSGDRTMVVGLTDAAEILSPLSTDGALATNAITRTRPAGSTALYTSLYVTLREMQARRDSANRRQAIALLSDGRDTSSLVSYEDVIDLARASGVEIYSIMVTADSTFAPLDLAALPSDDEPPTAAYVMRSFASETGGRFFPIRTTGDLGGIYRSIADELDAQYLVGYVSTNAARDGRYRRLSVEIVGHSSATARTKPGYQAPGRG
jgi:Ca-activated chloride channel family protein